MFSFTVEHPLKGTQARIGRLRTPHGEAETPIFMPVGTQASVKSLTPDDLKAMGATVILGNTYHLYLRPGDELVAEMGGLHGFMQWDGPMLTDSGGFQAFSLGLAREHGVGKIAGFFPDETTPRHPQPAPKPEDSKMLATIDEDGVTFRSHLDGSIHKLTPEKSISIQHNLGADIILVLDECTSPLSSYEYTRQAMERTHRWAERSYQAHKKLGGPQALFGIVQGGEYQDLREIAARTTMQKDFEGFAIGGSLGKTKADMHKVLEWTIPLLDERPRHLLGIGDIDDLFEGVERGVDMFDCVSPTRLARTAAMYVYPENEDGHRWRINLRNARYRNDKRPVQEGCPCYTCSKFSRAYLRHLFLADELLAYRLASLHNVNFLLSLMRDMRQSIKDGTFAALKARWLTGRAAQLVRGGAA